MSTAPREPEHDDGDAVEPDDDQQRSTRVPAHRSPCQHDRRAERTEGRGGTKEPEARRPHVENVLREDRQQRDRAAEKHGEQIERDGAEQHRCPAHEAHAAENAREVGG
jgi:hypothetical protein